MLVLTKILSTSGIVTVDTEMLYLLLLESGVVFPFLRQTIDGDGNPDVLQLKTTVPPAVPFAETLSSTNLGLTVAELAE